jgi:AraC-like DNA-binding protein
VVAARICPPAAANVVPLGQSSPATLLPGFIVHAVFGALAELPLVDDAAQPRPERLAAVDPAALALSLGELHELLTTLSARAENPALGLLVGAGIGEANLNLAGPLFVACRTLREAIEHATELQSTLLGPVLWRLFEDGEHAHFVCVEPAHAPATTQMVLALIFKLVRRFVGAKHRDKIWAHFDFCAPSDTAPYAACFGPCVRFGTQRPSVSFPRSVLDLPRPGTDPALALLLRQLAIERFTQPNTQGTWAARLGAALRAHRQLASVDIDEIAARWQISSRTLRHHLREEGESVTRILNQVRYERARALLDDTNVSIADIAAMLGYSEVSAFQRAFKRWSGAGAHAYRTRRR